MPLFGPSRGDLAAQLELLQAEKRAAAMAEEKKKQDEFWAKVQEDIVVIRDVTKPLSKLACELRDLKEGLKGMVDGLVAMTKVASDQLDQFTKAVEILQQSLSPGEGADYSAYAEDTPEAADRIRRDKIRKMMQMGLTEKEAKARLGEANIYEELARSRKS